MPVHRATGRETLAEFPFFAAERFASRPAQRFKRDGSWQDLSYAAVGEVTAEITAAKALSQAQPRRLGNADQGYRKRPAGDAFGNTGPAFSFSVIVYFAIIYFAGGLAPVSIRRRVNR